eukprot:PhM_4_TR3048/c0_g1_i1/m.45249
MPAVTRAAIGGGTNSRASALLDIFRGADSRGPETGTFVSNINSLFEGTGATSTQPAKTSAAARVSTTSPRFAMPHAMLTVGTGSPVRKWKCDGVVRSFVDARGAKMWLITVPAEIPTCSPNVSLVSGTLKAEHGGCISCIAHDAAALALLRGWSEYHITMRASPENLTTSPPYSRTLFTMISRYELTTPAKTCGPRSPSTCATEEYPLMSTNMTAASSLHKASGALLRCCCTSVLANVSKASSFLVVIFDTAGSAGVGRSVAAAPAMVASAVRSLTCVPRTLRASVCRMVRASLPWFRTQYRRTSSTMTSPALSWKWSQSSGDRAIRSTLAHTSSRNCSFSRRATRLVRPPDEEVAGWPSTSLTCRVASKCSAPLSEGDFCTRDGSPTPRPPILGDCSVIVACCGSGFPSGVSARCRVVGCSARALATRGLRSLPCEVRGGFATRCDSYHCKMPWSVARASMAGDTFRDGSRWRRCEEEEWVAADATSMCCLVSSSFPVPSCELLVTA